MKIPLCLIVTALFVAPAFAQSDPAGFAMWTAAELKQRDRALSTKVGPDHSSRETLAQYPTQRLRLLLRDADGAPEVHEDEVDVVIVQSGEGTLHVGGTMIGARGRGGVGTALEGGKRYALGPGDVAYIPARVPHAFLVPDGKHLTYILVKFPPPPE